MYAARLREVCVCVCVPLSSQYCRDQLGADRNCLLLHSILFEIEYMYMFAIRAAYFNGHNRKLREMNIVFNWFLYMHD